MLVLWDPPKIETKMSMQSTDLEARTERIGNSWCRLDPEVMSAADSLRSTGRDP